MRKARKETLSITMIFLNFLTLITRPKKALGQMLANPPGFVGIVIFLFIVSIVRGLLEVIWFYADMGLMSQLGYFLKSPSWHLFEFWPAIFSCILTVYVRWFAYVFFVMFLSRIFGSESDFKMLQKAYGVLLGIYMFPVILNFVYLFLPLPMITFNISKIYIHGIRLSQIVTAILFVYISTAIIITLQKIKRFEAFLISLAIPIIDRFVYVGSCLVLFNLPAITKLNLRQARFLQAVAFISACAFAMPIFLRLVRWFENRQKRQKLGVLK